MSSFECTNRPCKLFLLLSGFGCPCSRPALTPYSRLTLDQLVVRSPWMWPPPHVSGAVLMPRSFLMLPWGCIVPGCASCWPRRCLAALASQLDPTHIWSLQTCLVITGLSDKPGFYHGTCSALAQDGACGCEVPPLPALLSPLTPISTFPAEQPFLATILKLVS